MARSVAVAAWLAAGTLVATQAWRSTDATIIVPRNKPSVGQPLSVTLQIAETNLGAARIVWEAFDQEPVFGGTNYTFTPEVKGGPYWIEAEVQWPDGRRAFAMNSVIVNAPPRLSVPILSNGEFSFRLSGMPKATYVIQTATNLTDWQPVKTNTLPAGGEMQIVNSASPILPRRFYRVVKAP